MTTSDRARDSTCRQTSSKSAPGDVVEVVAECGRLAALHQGLCRAATECGNRLGAVPGHLAFLSSRPVGNPADDFEHLLDARLRLGRPGTIGLVQRLRA